MYRRCLLAVLLLSATAAGLSAQQSPPPLDPGTRVRVTFRDPDSTRVTGSFVHVDHRIVSITERAAGERVRDWRSVRLLEVSQGRSRAHGARRGGTMGAFVGSALGIIAGAVGALELYRLTDGRLRTEGSMALGAVGLGTLGGTLGAGVGALFTRERWMPYMEARRAPVAAPALAETPGGS
jgi:hypothetical protein